MTKCKKTKGVLLVNLGTPDSYRPAAVYRYLNEFLTDKRVIDMPWLQRQILVRGLIVPFRFRQSSSLYRQLWTSKGSPLLIHGRDVELKLQNALGESYHVVLGMRYQSPSIKQGLEVLKQRNVDEIIVLPLFPQYASATTGSVHQKVMECLRHWEVIPKLVLLNNYYDDPQMLQAFCERGLQYPIASYDHILFSFHGLPERHIRKADPAGKCLTQNCCQTICNSLQYCYKAQCYATAHALIERLSIPQNNFSICFQSRLGKDPWLQPYTSSVLQDCAAKGMKRVLVFCPSFVCDCLETTCEISYEYAEEFKRMGGEDLQLVEGLNGHPVWIEALKGLVLSSSGGPKNAT